MNTWRNGLNSGSNGLTAAGLRGRGSSPKGAVDYSRLPVADESDDEDDWIQKQIRGHKQVMARQDQDLEEIGQSVERLGHISLEISKELDSQNRQLGDLDQDFDRAIDNLDIVTRKTKDLVKKSGGLKNFAIIVFLIAVLVVLVVLVIYT